MIQNKRPLWRDPIWLAVLFLAACIWLLWTLCPLGAAEAQLCPPGKVCLAPPPMPAIGHEAIVRIIVDDGGGGSYGSGTIVGRKEGKAIVLTAAHLLSDRRGKVMIGVTGRLYEGKVLRVDRTMDLAALEISDPAVNAFRFASLSEKPLVRGAKAWASGYGSGSYRQVSGQFLQHLSPDHGRSWDWAEFSCAVRQGDSGGPILDAGGRLVAIVSCSDRGRTCGASFPRIRAFVAGLLGRGGNSNAAPERPRPPPVDISDLPKLPPPAATPEPYEPGPDFESPFVFLPKPSPPPVQSDPPGEAGGDGSDAASDWGELAAVSHRVEQLRDLVGKMPSGRASTTKKLIGGALTALGWTTPPSAAAIVGFAFLRWWLRRRSRHKGGAAPADTTFRSRLDGIPRDDREAAELVRLAQREGRSPLHDAVVGMFAFDELDKTIESGGPAAPYAQTLRGTLEKRFNEVAPVAV